MKIDTLLSRLEKVRKTGSGRYIACCPSHDDKHPSMTIRETDEGTVLIHCFASCSVEEILSSVDLTFADLYPDTEYGKSLRRPFSAHDVMECVSNDLSVITIVGSALVRGDTVSEQDILSMKQSVARVNAARDIANG